MTADPLKGASVFQVLGSPRYNSDPRRKDSAPVAQRLEQQTHNLLVRGSNPCGGTNPTLFRLPNQFEPTLKVDLVVVNTRCYHGRGDYRGRVNYRGRDNQPHWKSNEERRKTAEITGR